MIQEKMVRSSNFTFVSHTRGENMLKTVGDESLKICEVFDHDDNITMKLSSSTHRRVSNDLCF